MPMVICNIYPPFVFDIRVQVVFSFGLTRYDDVVRNLDQK